MNENKNIVEQPKNQNDIASRFDCVVSPPLSLVTNEDCMDMMSRYPDKFFELAVVDPPYGIGYEEGGQYFNSKYDKKDWDKVPAQEYFNEVVRVSQNQIIWGGNYFNLPPCRCFIIWYKTVELKDRTFSECEFAWTSFNEPSRLYEKKPFQRNGTRIHPTQKPIELYDWIFSRWAGTGYKILDTHLGSGSSRIAAWKAKLDFYGCELDRDYYEAQEDRFKKFVAQLTLW